MNKSLLIIIVSFILISCSKSGDTATPSPTPTPTPTPTEATIAFGVDIDPGVSNIFASAGASQVVIVNVTSTLPSTGVTIDLITKKDSDGSLVSSSSISSTSAKTTMSIDNLQSGILCTTTVTVTSKSKTTNTLSSSFKIARK